MNSKLQELFDRLRRKDKSFEELSLEVGTQLKLIEDELESEIIMEVRNLRYAERHGKKRNPRSVEKLKNAYYGLKVVKEAQENLWDITTTNEVYRTLQNLSDSINRLNGLSGKASSVDGKKLAKRYDKMTDEAASRGQQWREDAGITVDDLVSESVVADLISGKTIDECIENDGGMSGEMDTVPLGGGVPWRDIAENDEEPDIEDFKKNQAYHSLLD